MAAVDAKTRLAIELVLRDLATKDLKKFDNLVSTTTKKGRKGFLGMSGSITTMIGRISTLTAGMVGFALVVGKLRKGFSDFFSFAEAMAEVNTIFRGTNEELEEAAVNVRALALSLGVDEVKVAKGLYQTLSSSISDTTDAFRVMKTATELAVAGVATSAQAVNLMTTELNAFQLQLDQKTLTALADLNFKAVELGKVTIPELAASMGKAAPFAAQLSVSLEEVFAVIDVLSIGGISAPEAFTGLRQVLKSLLQPSKDAEVAFDKLFNGQLPSAIIETEGLVGVLKRLEDEFGGNEEALTAMFTNVRAVTPILAITGKQADKFRDILDQLSNAAGAFGLALDKSMLSPGRRLKILLVGINQGFEDLADTLIEVFSPGIEDIEEIRQQAQGLKEDMVLLQVPIRAIGTLVSAWATAFSAAAFGIGALGHALGQIDDEQFQTMKLDLLALAELTARLTGLTDAATARTLRTQRELARQEMEKILAGERALELAEELRRLNAIASAEFADRDLPRIIKMLEEFDEAMTRAGEDGSKMFMELRVAMGLWTIVVSDGLDDANRKQETFFQGWNAGWKEIQKTLTAGNLGRETAFQMFGALESGLDQFTRDLVDGEANFKQFAQSLIKELVAIALKMLILKSITSFLPGFSAGGTGDSSGTDNGDGGTSLALGGIMSGRRMSGNLPIKAYASGGIADRPQLAVFGEGGSPGGEAFVPLGPSRKIGVEIKNKGVPGEMGKRPITLNLNVQSIDPRGAAEVILAQMPLIQKQLARALVRGETRALTTAVRSVARGGN